MDFFVKEPQEDMTYVCIHNIYYVHMYIIYTAYTTEFDGLIRHDILTIWTNWSGTLYALLGNTNLTPTTNKACCWIYFLHSSSWSVKDQLIAKVGGLLNLRNLS